MARKPLIINAVQIETAEVGFKIIRAYLFPIDALQRTKRTRAIVADNCADDIACIARRIQKARHSSQGRI